METICVVIMAEMVEIQTYDTLQKEAIRREVSNPFNVIYWNNVEKFHIQGV